MQQLNYYTLRALHTHMQAVLAGGRWQDAFTQQRDELVVVFRTAERRPYFVRIGCRPDFPFLLPQELYRRARSNSVNLFTELQGAELLGLELAATDRLLRFGLSDGWQVVLKLHGARANVLVVRGGVVQNLFRTQLEADYGFAWPTHTYAPPSTEAELTAALAATQEPGLAGLRQVYPFWDRWFVAKASELVAGGRPVWQAVQAVQLMALKPRPHVVPANGTQPPGFLLFPLGSFPQAEPQPDVQTGLSLFVGRWLAWVQTRHLRRDVEKALERLWATAQQKAAAARNALLGLQNARPPEELAHLLMANLHLANHRDDSVVVRDFFNNDKALKIKLDPRLSVQENAARLYAQQKESRRRLAHLHLRLKAADDFLHSIETLRRDFPAIDNHKALERFAKQNAKLLNLQQLLDAVAAAPNEAPFRRFLVSGFTVWVGRNAKNNDLLTFGHARKEDLWLHAKDVQGSHVVVRVPKNTTLPLAVLEVAAGLAAWFSKAKGSAMVPVAYTSRKFVRKTRHLPPGAVIVEREQVIDAEPLDPETLRDG